MSHAPQRKEKDCLNCGTIVQGRFCHVCGQENIVPHESFWSMLHHFFADITHFDGKFFSSLFILIRKPGFLSSEYIHGRRNSYLNPVRMYVFTAAVFFTIFFAVFNSHDITITGKNVEKAVHDSTRSILKKKLENAKTHDDSVSIQNSLSTLTDTSGKKDADAAKEEKKLKVTTKFVPFDERYTSLAQYDSIQQSLPVSKKDGWFRRIANRKSLEIGEHYKNDNVEFWVDVLEKFMHSFPYMLFVSLPLYALFLKILYFRRKQFFYADHGIFLIHLYIFTFILLLFLIGINKIESVSQFALFGFLIAALIIYGLYYALKAMKNFYKQGWVKTIVKFVVFNILCVLALSILFTIFFGLSLFRL
ncbi:MAG: DUF3667 domain-containing protein [Bacteroidota bacterium]